MDWAEVDRLVSDDQYQAAADLVAEILAAAREAGDEPQWTRALVKEVLLRTGLHGYETAVRFLKEEPWPGSPRYHLVLELFYAQSLTTYVNAYSWEIRQREKVISTDEVDLRKWTLDQLAAEARRAYLEVWEQRDEWGGATLGDLAEYFETGNYPAHVRGTLRDTVTYLWVALLADTSLWRPEHANEVYRLDLGELLSGGGAVPDLADPEVHPLVKVAAALRDLEDWHVRNQRPEAAFEARLELLRRLSVSFTQKDDRETLRGDLRERLDALGRQYPWWSVGMAALAEMVRQDDAPGALVEARRIAADGERAHPDSIGGERCRAIVAAIEQPSYDLAAMASDGLHRRSIQVRHKNLSELHFRAYALDLEERVSTADDSRLLPSNQDVPRILETERPAAEWTVELPATPDYRTHTTYVTPPLERPSLYLVVASARRDFAEAFNRRTAVSLIVSDLVLLRSDPEKPAVRVLSGETGAPASGVEVSLYLYNWRQGHAKIEDAVTGEDGEARFRMELSNRERYFVLARRGDDVALLEGLYSPYRREREESVRSLIYTDRSVYRPGQNVQWKVVAYRQKKEPGSFEVFAGARLSVSLLDANGQEAGKAEAVTNDFGSASGEFEIPAGRLLGYWQVRAEIAEPRRTDQVGVKVEEYKRPTFDVEIEKPGDALRLNRPATLHGTVRYYFGLPVTSGEVAWRVTRTPVWRWYRWLGGPGIVPGGTSPQPEFSQTVAPQTVSPQTVAAGTAELGPDGRFEVTFTPEADERLAETGVSYRYQLAADVTDAGGETRSASRLFRLGFVAVEASIEDPPGFFRGGEEPGELTVARRDLDGNPRPGVGRFRLLELVQPERTPLPADLPALAPPSDAAEDEGYTTPGDRLRPRWASGAYSPEDVLRGWDDGAEVGGGEVRHDEDGVARIVLPDLAPGAYRIRYSTTDDFGAVFELAHEFVLVGGDDTPLAVPGLLAAERKSVAVGGVARFAVHSGLAGQDMELAIYRGGGVIRRRMTAGPGVQVLEFPVGPGDRGGFGVRLTLVSDHQLVSLAESISVPWSDRELDLEFATFRDKMRPGESETWTIRVKGADDALLAAGTAELLAYMYDKSLDLFATHTPPDVLAVYPRFGGIPAVQASLGPGQVIWNSIVDFSRVPPSPRLTADRLKILDGYGIGGPGRRVPLAARRLEKMTMNGAPPRPMPMAAPAPMPEQAMAPDLGALAPSGEAEREAGAEPPAQAADALRADFSETAFWQPHLLTGADGTVKLEFTVPDSLTEWNVWVHALTKDLRYGRLERQVRTAKELMVRPYLPRFLREGDRAELRVVVNNAGGEELRGRLDFEIRDPETEEDLSAAFGLSAAARGAEFTAPAGGGADLAFPIRVPSRLGTVAFVAHATAGDLSDGELRPLPVLPSRVHLAQSRFATLRDRDKKVLSFEDLARNDDPTRENDQMVVTLDAQLFYSVLSALPYLANYPYECTEQLLNRFLSTGILSTLYEDYPAVGKMAARLSERETPYEAWAEDDPNRKMLLEETPWLQVARGGEAPEEGLANVLDPKAAAATRDVAMAKLREAQTSSGGFPWWPGGPPSPYMTLYIVDGFSRALEHGVDVPQDLVARAWSYLHRYYVEEVARDMVRDDCCWETVTYLNYVLSNYPDSSWTGGLFTDDDRKTMLELSLRHWRRHSPRLKCYLALTLHRAGRDGEARQVFASVMDSSKTTEDQGTFWAPEERAWLWYNDTIESHAFVLRTLLELAPDDARRHGLVQWLYLNKHLGHWKSTRATAEVIYSLVHYLEAEGTLGAREEATVTLGGEKRTFTFEPDRYTGKDNRVVIAGGEVDESLAEIVVEKETPGFLFASATWHFSTEELPEEARGDFFAVTRSYFRRVHDGREWVLEPIAEGAPLSPGDQVEVHLSLKTKHAAEYVHLRDPRGAGFEPESLASGYHWDLGIGWYEEVRDSGTNFFFEWLPVGEYTFTYRLRANVAGTFRVGPATVQSMYAPEFVAYSSGAVLEIAP